MVEAKKKPEKKEKKFQRKKKGSIFYMGPTIKRGILEKGAVYRGELPKEVEEIKKEKPILSPLFVDKKGYVEACRELRDLGSRLSALYKRAEGGK
ncbi:hypothetical protein PM10SUCC1_02650 [Propionigenium maris DSM 9537]|uniref:Uncharacterized protein n=1 Tax=Propionigenium maris DSM 9537 TaxID=1123000 RepID=A0A9W6GIT7_9FUSO|nr:hypothetical protein [Propionigenium maris]GLI54750.1 hypothetical protein PM10SUCC1_02650 [Propionigenium maris DSM 9537]